MLWICPKTIVSVVPIVNDGWHTRKYRGQDWCLIISTANGQWSHSHINSPPHRESFFLPFKQHRSSRTSLKHHQTSATHFCHGYSKRHQALPRQLAQSVFRSAAHIPASGVIFTSCCRLFTAQTTTHANIQITINLFLINQGMPAITMARTSRTSRTQPPRKQARNDRDGDVSMEGVIRTSNRVKKSIPRTHTTSHKSTPSNSRDPFKAVTVQRESLRRVAAHITSDRTTAKLPPPSRRARSAPESTQTSTTPSRLPKQAERGPLVLKKLHITGWKASKASTNEDGGVQALVAFIEKKATDRKIKHNKSQGFSTGGPVKVRSHTVNNDTITIEVTKSDYAATIRLNGYEFAGAPITIESDARRQGKEEDMDMSNSDEETGLQVAPAGGAVQQGEVTDEERRTLMLQEVMKQTNMTEEYARLCLEAGEWDWERAGALYVERREQLPAEAFM